MDIREDIKRYQDTLSYPSSKVDYSMGENIYMLPSNMNLKIKTGNGIMIKFSFLMGNLVWGKTKNVNALVLEPTSREEPVIPMPKGHPSHQVVAQQTQAKKPTTHEDEKITLTIFLSGGFTIWNIF